MNPREHGHDSGQNVFEMYTKVAMDPIKEIEGFDYGEWNTGAFGEKSEAEFTVISKLCKAKAQTSVGGPQSKYRNNEDAVFVISRPNRFAVGIIDGAGGSRNGLLAAQIASAEFARGIKNDQGTTNIIEEVNSVMRINSNGGYATGVILEIDKDTREATIVGAGDSKAMTLRKVKKVEEGNTHFQNVAQRGGDTGNILPHEYYTNGRLNEITGGFGIPNDVKAEPPEIKKFIPQEGDIIILASDGFWDNISEYEVEQIVATTSDFKDLENTLFTLAYQRNNDPKEFEIKHDARTIVRKKLTSGDNITVAVVEINNI